VHNRAQEKQVLSSEEEVAVIQGLVRELTGRTYTGKQSKQNPVDLHDILLVASTAVRLNKAKAKF